MFVSASYALGCSCWGFHTSEEYIISDFVGVFQVEATFSDSTGTGLYTAEINPVTIYKGTAPQSIKVAGSKKGDIQSSRCEIKVKSGEVWLVALTKNDSGNYKLTRCSFAEKIKSEEGMELNNRSAKKAMHHFSFLKRHIPDLYREFSVSENTGNIYKFLRKYEDQSFNKSSAHYLLRFNKQFEITNIEVLQGLSSEFDKELSEFLQSDTKWKRAGVFGNNEVITNTTEYVLDIYHNSEKNSLSRTRDF